MSFESEISNLRSSLAAAIRIGGGLPVVAPLLTTKQEERTRDLLVRLVNEGAPAPTLETSDAVWFVGYSAELLPESDTLAWTKDLEGTATAAVSGHLGTLALVEGDTSGHLWYSFSHALASSTGATLEAEVKVLAGEMLLRIADGSNNFDLLVTGSTLLLDDGSARIVSRDLATGGTIRMTAEAGLAQVYFDYGLVSYGSSAGSTSEQLVGFGSDPADNTKVCTIEVMNVRAADRKL